jgi:hypothetical protein
MKAMQGSSSSGKEHSNIKADTTFTPSRMMTVAPLPASTPLQTLSGQASCPAVTQYLYLDVDAAMLHGQCSMVHD